MLLQKLTEFFSTWEVQLSVLLSMLIQIFLVFFGSRRKISKAIWLKVLVWCAYMSADAVAIFSLGVLARDRGEPSRNHQLQLLWVPFLILHLGGPDTITAYSLEDNNLWLRHMLNLVIQIGVALYAVVKSWNTYTHNPLTYLVIPIFIWGVVKYCERIWALKSATLEQIHDRLSSGWKIDPPSPNPIGTYFNQVYRFLSTLTYYFAYKLPPRNNDFYGYGRTILRMKSWDAFKLVEDELGLMYDLLYTKALLIYSPWGICLRCVYLVSSLATLTSFVIIDKHNEAKWSHAYPLSDVLITYFLMIGAFILEIYAVIWVVLSDWILIRLDKHQNNHSFVKFLFRMISTCRRVLLGEKRWSRSLEQHNIISNHIGLATHRDAFPISLLPSRWKKSELSDTISVEVEGGDARDMKEQVFHVIRYWWYHDQDHQPENMEFSAFMDKIIDLELYSSFLKQMLSRPRPIPDGIQFGTSLYSWHIVTNLHHYSDDYNMQDIRNSGSKVHFYYKASRYLSDYMYLVRFHDDMLPPGNYKQTYPPLVKVMDDFFDGFSGNMDKACERFFNDYDFYRSSSLIGEIEEFEATKQVIELALALNDRLKGMSNPTLENKWEKISKVWIHLLVYAAANQHKWVEHAQQLRRGGEFLTHVAVLIAHASTSKMHVGDA